MDTLPDYKGSTLEPPIKDVHFGTALLKSRLYIKCYMEELFSELKLCPLREVYYIFALYLG